MSRFWSKVVNEVEPYVPGEQPKIDDLIKLNTNENPYPPSARVAEVLGEPGTIERLRLYPDPESTRLKQAIASYYGVQQNQIFVGNGSDEVLGLLFVAFFKQDKPLLLPDITYSFYPVYCQLFGITIERIPVREDFRIELADYDRPNGGIIFANPNAPTGMLLPLVEIEALLQRNRDTVVVVDEAYIDFGGDTAIALVDKYPNLLVVQTLSKSRSLAGVRMGFAIGHPDLINGLERIKNSFNSYPVDRLAEAAATVAIEDRAHFEECRARIIATRERTREGLVQLGFEVLPSQANFVFARPPAGATAAALAKGLRDHRILVRYFNSPRIDGFLRITIGTDPEMTRLLEVLAALMAEN